MIESKPHLTQIRHALSAAIVMLITLTGVMMLALFTQTAPHPPLEVPPFALGPFLGASLAIGTAAFYLSREKSRYTNTFAIIFALTALVSFGPQKYLDPVFLRIWPSVVTAQLAIGIIFISCYFEHKKSP